MPMNENEKKELVKRIMEQRKAMWKGEIVADRRSGQPILRKEKSANVAPSAGIPSVSDIPVVITKDEFPSFDNNEDENLDGHKKRFSLKEELKKGGELGFRVTFSVISILITALLMGIIIGYLLTVVNFSKML